MKTTIRLALTALALASCATVVEAGLIKKAENFESAMLEAKKTNRPVLLEFYAPW